jgi:starch phosphorylase
MYEPIAAQSDALAENHRARARELAAWKKRVSAAWPEVKVDVDPDPVVGLVDLGAEREVTAEVYLGSLSPDDVAVELLHGQVVAGDELADTKVVRLERADFDGGGGGAGAQGAVVRYRGRFSADQAGRHGYAVRVVPSHRDLLVPVELGCVTWA